ncbi:beta-lactamase hydrolase domain-containing protein [Engelhardtia mirabilis]|uniref:Beta-lactamase hydrolase-like protein n=1 Tax=Engelhardtia mirabilis TaxID=2528011 RepID=A0A518BEQ5_9BACT|nr:hypothetical protein Pla133_05440 [Planctomycetes bacterium Pla133]QDU99805.1 hypothetical protein Pla86_05440 [Planctomycetes bacterium Pla86]
MPTSTARSLALTAALGLAAACSSPSEPQTQASAAPQEHVAIVTETLEPYECGTITRLNTMGGLFLASQPQPADLEQAVKGGVKTVINQRHEDENPEFDERAFVEGLGLAYYNPGFNGPDELTDEVIDETLELLRTVERPAMMHCSSANRTGAIWLAYRSLDGGLDWDAALAEAKVVGLRSPDYELIVKDYVDRHSGR